MSIVSYKCHNCGGDLKFDPESQKLKCEYCLSAFTEDEVEKLTKQNTFDSPGKEIIEEEKVYYDVPEGGVYLYTCPSCGAEIITDSNTSATTCWYCHNPVVFSKQLDKEFKPSKIIPFKKSKEQALNVFKTWCGKKKFLPNDFSAPSQLDKIAGLYVPYWLIDCETHGHLRGTGKKIRSWTQGQYRYTKTDIFSISRSADMNFSYLPHDASLKADDKVMDSIADYDFSELENFSFSYLSGFIADKYDVPKEDVYPIIKERIKQAVNSELRSSVHGYTTTSYASSNVQINRTNFHYALMPTWVLTYSYKGDTYTYAMNGQTGKTFGSMPISMEKVNRFAIILFLIIFAIITFILLYIGGIPL